MINVLADQYLYKLQSYLPDDINLVLFDPAQGFPKELKIAHALLVRTVIPVNNETLSPLPPHLEFVGTASAGSDHVDTGYLERHGIAFSDAAGCNARSVAEYVATALLLWSEKRSAPLQQHTVGIIGAGNVGKQVEKLLDRLNVSTVAYDPPREKRDKHFVSSPVDQLLKCDILTFHTPLTRESEHPTFHWLDKEKLSNRRYELIINTARGGVIDETALLRCLAEKKVKNIIIDTWENEPQFNLDTARKAFIKTPHIAGYSEEAKRNASKLVAAALLNHFEIPQPKKEKQQNRLIFQENISAYDALTPLLKALHPIQKYESKLVEIMEHHPGKRATYFNRLRAEFPLRREFAQICLPPTYFERFPVLTALGFSKG